MGGKSGVLSQATKVATKAVEDVKKTAKKVAPKLEAVEKGVSSVSKSAGKAGGKLGKTLGKGAEKLTSSTGRLVKSAAKGDFKGVGKAGLDVVQSGKDMVKGSASGALTASLAAPSAIGAATGDKNITRMTSDVEREGQKGITNYGDQAIDTGLMLTPGVGQGYALGKSAASSMAEGGSGALLSSQGVQDFGSQAVASKYNLNPNLIKTGLSATKGDLKSTALSRLGSMAGIDSKVAYNLAKGKVDPMQFAGVGSEQILGGVGDKLGMSSYLKSPEAQQFLEMGRSAGRTVSSADAYVKDAQNAAMDMQAKALQTAQGYKIKPGETLGAIAKRMGVSVEELKAANPQIKDINKIAAGANLNIPESVQRYETPEQTAARKKATNEAAIANQKREPGFLDKAKDFFGGAKDAIGSAVGAAKDFAAENKTGLGIAADATAAALGYKAGEEGRAAAAKLAKEQLADLQSAGKQFEQMRYDPTRYKQEREFIEQRIAGGGITPQEKLMQQQGDLRAARAGAAARLAGVEQQARMGGRGMAGSALAASLAGGQSVMGEQAATNLQREASASQRLEQDIQRGTNLSRQQTEEEARLAQEQGQFGLTRAQQTGSVRGDLGNLEMGRAGALQNLYSKGADFVKQGLAMAKTQDELNQEKQQREMQAESQRLDLEKKRRDVYGAPTTQTTTPPPVDQAKIDAARRLSQRGQTQVPQTNVPKPATPPAQFNQQNQRPQPGAGQGYGVLAPVSQGIQQGQQAVQKVQSTMDEAKKKADELKKNPLGAFGVKF